MQQRGHGFGLVKEEVHERAHGGGEEQDLMPCSEHDITSFTAACQPKHLSVRDRRQPPTITKQHEQRIRSAGHHVKRKLGSPTLAFDKNRASGDEP